jgi:protein involved in polysaccharide export with SLBB domain
VTRFAVIVLAFVLTSAVPHGSGPACEEAGAGAPPASYEASLRTAAGALEGTLDAGQYILGPGDVLVIGFWGEVNRSDKITVNPDGDVLVSPVGPLRVAGLTLESARALIRERLAPYYRPGVLSVSLISVRTFEVHVVGMVKKPGTCEVNGVTRVSQAITLAGGALPGASERNVLVMRGADTLRVDLARYLLLGDNAKNPFLGDGDVIYVPPRVDLVEVLGSVYREGSFEFTPGETIGELVDLAGGPRAGAAMDSIELQRFTADDPTKSEEMFLSGADSVTRHFEVARGDRIFIRGIPGWHEDSKVLIRGEVKRPGYYVIDEGTETLTQLVARAGGFTEKASLAEARLIRGAYAARKFPVETQIDTLGAVQNTLTDKQKGLVNTLRREPKGAVAVNFEQVFAAKGRRPDPPLYDGDVIDIPRAALFVRVSGQVKTPGLVAFKPGEGSQYYIRLAGGFAPGADGSGTRLVTALNGQMTSPGGMVIRPGDIVWVPAKPERSWWSTTKDVLQVLAQVATIYVVADQIAKR